MPKVFEVIDELSLEGTSSETYTLIIKGNKVNLTLNFLNGDYNLLVYNYGGKDLDINEKGTLTNSNVNITYIDLNDNVLNHRLKYEVNNDSNLIVNTIYLGVNSKDIVLDIYNAKSNATSLITNNVVCLDDASFNLEVIGNILKGAKSSKCHQKSQCLTFGKPKKARVLPVLNIDENDVEASHSLSCGTIDEEVLFYMNSRGLSLNDSLGLILSSYLMPSEDFYLKYPDGLKVKELAESKVSNLCSM